MSCHWEPDTKHNLFSATVVSGYFLPYLKMMATYTLCDTAASVNEALGTLSGAETVFLDCEGVELGHEEGTLAVISVGTVIAGALGVNQLSIFLFDMVTLKSRRNRNVKRIMALMQSETPKKVMFDGRMDACEFFHGSRVKLQNVIDLQVVDVLSRAKRQEGIESQLQRLKSFVPPWEIQKNQPLYSRLTKLHGLDSALREHGVTIEYKKRIDHNKWINRPLDPEYLQYAVEDIQKIQILYETMITAGYIPATGLEEKCALYISLHYNARPAIDDPYKSHGLLPLAAFRPIGPGAIQCQGCERELPPSSFLTGAKRRGRKGLCLVCQAVDCHIKYRAQWKKNKEQQNAQKESK